MHRLSIRSTAGHAAALVGTFSIGWALMASPAIATEDIAAESTPAALMALPSEDAAGNGEGTFDGVAAASEPSDVSAANQEPDDSAETVDDGADEGDGSQGATAGDESAANVALDAADESEPQPSPELPPSDSDETPADAASPSADDEEDPGDSAGAASLDAPAAAQESPAPDASASDPSSSAPKDTVADEPADPPAADAPQDPSDAAAPRDQDAPSADPDATLAVLQDATVAAAVDASRGTLTMVARDGAFADSWGVSFKVTGSRGTQWVSATRQGDGSWSAALSLGALGSGTLSIEAWANCGSSPAAAYATTSAAVPATGAQLSLAYDAERSAFVLSAKEVSCPTGVSFVSVGLTSPSGTTRWYRLDNQSDGTWSATVDPATFGWEAGTYTLTGSICDALWAGVACGTARCTVAFGTEAVRAEIADNGRMQLETTGGRFTEAWGVSFAITSTQGTTWVPAQKQVDGTWRATAAIPGQSGASLQIAAWANVASAPAFSPASTTLAVPASSATLSLDFDAERQRLALRATNVTCPSGVTFVSVGVTSPKGTTIWHRLAQQEDGSWAAWINPSAYAWQSGTYTLAASICDAQWAGVAAGTTTATVSYGKETLSATAASNGSDVHITAAGGRYADAWNVSFQISGSSQSSWVAGVRQSDGSWTLDASAATWGGGQLTIAAYAALDGATLLLGSTQVMTTSQTAAFSCTPQPKDDTVLATATGGVFSTATNVAFEIYNVGEGRGSTSWYQARKQSDGSWSAQIPADVQGVGTCVATAWATNNGSTTAIANTRYTYSVAPTIVSEIELGSGGYDVSYGMSGLKVQRIQQALGIGSLTYPRYLDETVSAVRNFQSRAGLPATGVVDRATWLSLGLNDQEWYTLGAYASPVRVGTNATAAERVEAMIGRAREYLGDPYVWDAAGAPGQGVDCAGLVMQSLYAAGLSTGIINPITHATTSWGDHDASNYYSYGGFTKTGLGDRVRGDLIYYGTDDAINHVAIYLGNDQIIEAYPGNVRLNSLWKASILGVTRVFS